MEGEAPCRARPSTRPEAPKGGPCSESLFAVSLPVLSVCSVNIHADVSTRLVLGAPGNVFRRQSPGPRAAALLALAHGGLWPAALGLVLSSARHSKRLPVSLEGVCA